MNLSKANLVLLVLAAVLAVPTFLQLQREADAFTDVGRIPLLFDGFTADNVHNIVLAQPKKEQPPQNPQAAQNPGQKPPIAYDQLLLQRTDKGWQLGQVPGMAASDLGGAPVLKERVENDVFAHLRLIRNDREVLVQPNATPEQLASYGLDEAQAFVIKASDRQGQLVLADVLVGREASAGQTGTEAVRGVFVRKADSTDVVLYEYDQQKAWRRDVDATQWLDKVLLRIEPDKLQRLSLRNAASAGTKFTFARQDGKASWTAVEPPPDLGAVRQTEVENFAQRFRYLAAQDFRVPLARAGNLKELGLQPPQLELELVWKDGEQERTATLSVGNKVDGKNEYYLTCSESQFLLTWPAGVVVPFERDPRELFDPQAPKEEPKPPEVPKDDKKENK